MKQSPNSPTGPTIGDRPLSIQWLWLHHHCIKAYPNPSSPSHRTLLLRSVSTSPCLYPSDPPPLLVSGSFFPLHPPLGLENSSWTVEDLYCDSKGMEALLSCALRPFDFDWISCISLVDLGLHVSLCWCLVFCFCTPDRPEDPGSRRRPAHQHAAAACCACRSSRAGCAPSQQHLQWQGSAWRAVGLCSAPQRGAWDLGGAGRQRPS